MIIMVLIRSCAIADKITNKKNHEDEEDIRPLKENNKEKLMLKFCIS